MEKKNKTRLARAAMTLLLALLTTVGAWAQQTLTVCDGTSNNEYVPFYGYYADAAQHNQMIYPATNLTAMVGKAITQMVFYIDESASNGSYTAANRLGTWKVSLGETSATTLNGLDETTSLTQVYQGYFDCSTGTLTLTFENEYTYNGGNLLVDLSHAAANWNRWYFLGVTAEGASYCYYSQRNFLPKATFSYETPAACPKPTNLAVSNITNNSATLNWTENGTATSWQICLNNDEDHLITTGSKPYTLTGLSTLTNYTVKVRSVGSGENSEWSSSVSFNTTAVAEAVGNSWSDDFEGASCGWELINGELTNAWAWGTAVNNGGTHALYISNDGGTTNAYTNNAAAMVYATKLLNFAEGKYEFSYDWLANGESTYDYLRVALVPATVTLSAGTSVPSGFSATALPTGWIALDGGSKLNLVTAWQNKTVAVNVPAGNYYLVVAWRNDTSSGTNPPAAIDNVSITKVTCSYEVADLAVSNITTTGATLAWTAGGATQWQVAYSTNSNFEGATESIVSEATCNLTGLQPASHYYAKVRAYCGGEDFGSWSSVLEFNTDCIVIDLSTADYSENFDGTTVASAYSPSTRTLPICWSFINTSTYATYAVYPTIYYYNGTDYSHSTPNSLRFYSYYSSNGNYDPQDQYAILPPMENLAGKQITLYARDYYSSSTFKVGTMSDPTDASTFTVIATQEGLTTSYPADAFEYIIPSTCTDNYVAIMIEAANSSRNYNGVFIDDITIREAPTCIKPTGVTTSDVTAHGATISWTSEASEWVVAYKAEGDDNFTEVAVTEKPYTLSDLDPETNYSVKVHTNCGSGNFSDWTNPVNFTTTVACPAPTVAVNNITTTTAEVSCTNTEADNFNVMLGEEVVAENVAMPYTLTGLTSNTTYTVKVQAICGGEDGSSSYSSGTTFMTGDICPDGMVCIGAGTATSNNVPVNNYFKYGLTQQIYTADEIGAAGAIFSIDFYKASNTEMVKNLDIYIVSTDKDEFTGTLDWIPVTESDKVFSGTVTFVDNDWTTIVLDNPFIYDGRSNICIVVDNNTGDYKSSTPFRVFTAEKNQTIYQQSDGLNLDPTTTLTTSGSRMTSKNRIRLGIGEPPACPKPTGLAVNYEDGITATVTWNGEATSYNIDVNGTVTEGVTSPYTLENLELATTYEVKVQADCGGAQSEWTNPVSFTTDMCMPEDMCEITFALTDSYGDGWNGAYIEVVDVETGASLGQMSNQNFAKAPGSEEAEGTKAEGAKAEETETYTLAVCNGREIQFVWHSGSYDSECSYVVTDISGDEIFSGNGAMSEPVNYTVNCTVDPCRKPSGLAASNIEAMGANLSWRGVHESYNIRYRQPAVSTDPTELATIILTAGDVWGDNSGYQMLLDADATAYGITIPTSGPLTQSGDASDATYAEFEYKIPENADGALDTENIVFNNSITIQIPAGTYDWCITNPSSGARMWIVGDGNVPGRYDNFVFEPGVTYEFSMQMFGDGDGAAFTVTPMSDWITVGNVTSPYELSGLTPSTPYEFQVQGISSVCDNGVTEWSEPANFITTGEPLKFAAEGYATYYNSQNDVVLPTGMKAFIVTLATATSADDATLEYETIADGNTGSNVVHAGNAMMLQVAPAEAARTISIGLATGTTGSYTGNKLYGSDTRVDITTLDDYSADNNYYYMLSYDTSGSNIGWYWDKDNTDGTGFWSAAHKAWLVLPKSLFQGSGAPFLGLPGWEETTGIVPVGVNSEDGEWYTLQGLKIGKKPTTAGVYIHNGRKVIVK